MSSSGSRALRFGPTKNPSMSTTRRPRTDSTSTRARQASSGGWASPAGDAVARLPPTVPRLRIWGEPTVRAASASPGQAAASSSTIRA